MCSIVLTYVLVFDYAVLELEEDQALLLWLVSFFECFANKMIFDTPPSGAQSVRTNRTSFGSSIGNGSTPLHSYATVSNGDDYDSDGSNFAPPWAFSFLLNMFWNFFSYSLMFINLFVFGKMNILSIWDVTLPIYYFRSYKCYCWKSYKCYFLLPLSIFTVCKQI
jgi:hypothetical protein